MNRISRTTVEPALLRRCRADGPLAQNPPPGVTIYRREAPSPLESYLYDPVLCMVLQGAKTMRSGSIEVRVGPGDALVVSHHLPVVSQIVEASPDAPYLAIVLTLDQTMVRELASQMSDMPDDQDGDGAISCKPYDQAWLEPLERYLALVDEPPALDVLGPSVLREVHYRLLISAPGAILRNMVYRDSHASRIARAIALIRADVSTRLAIAALATEVGMSVSAFHNHFKAVTGTSPLQYQKDLRLITARGLLEGGRHSVSSAAFAVGYESPTHFSRDYKRKFAHNPSSQTASAVLQGG